MRTVQAFAELLAPLPQLVAEARLRGADVEAARRSAPDFADKLKQAGVAFVSGCLRPRRKLRSA